MQRVNLYQPMSSDRIGHPPLVIQASVARPAPMIADGVPAHPISVENYVLLSALPVELQQRVITAIQALQAGG